jgi:DNA polymerase III sliding clamp (beta) subunit (PCNA family)
MDMASFAISSKLRLNIEGVEYAVFPFAPEVSAAAGKFADAIRGIQLEDVVTATDAKKVTAIQKAVSEMVESTLGKGMYQKINPDDAMDCMDHMELGTYIAKEISEYRAKRLAGFMQNVVGGTETVN